MKKLSKFALNGDIVSLDEHEMKKVLGGYTPSQCAGYPECSGSCWGGNGPGVCEMDTWGGGHYFCTCR